jgi:S-adenosylmethionine:tRNA ribosyltransferase-isomerase
MECYKELSLYDYPLPKEYIAQHPLPRRDASRLMILHRDSGELEHRHFWNLPEYLKEGDSLVLNNSKVLHAKLVGKRSTGGRVKLLLIEEVEAKNSGKWRVLLETRGIPQEGEKLDIEGEGLQGHLLSRLTSRQWLVQLEPKENLMELLERVGRMPLPPYIKRPLENDPFLLEDRERYQSVVATQPGSIAAPTACLHFTKALLQELSQRGVNIVFLTLHVGLGTFTPINTPDITGHTMEREYYELGPETARRLNETKRRGRRIIAVGSTPLRVLETVASQGELSPSSGWTNLFIYPPYKFKLVDALVTNFHLPRTTLLVLVSTFAGREKILKAYSIAKKEGYRFYSYGDAMLIL